MQHSGWDARQHLAEERINNRYTTIDTRRLHVGSHLASEKWFKREQEAVNQLLRVRHAEVPHYQHRLIMPENQQRNPLNVIW